MNIAAWLLAFVGPIVIRAIIAMGFVAVSYAGVDILVNGLVATAQTSWSSIPTAVLQLASLSGIPDVLGMIMGAYLAVFTSRYAIMASRYVFKPK